MAASRGGEVRIRRQWTGRSHRSYSATFWQSNVSGSVPCNAGGIHDEAVVPRHPLLVPKSTFSVLVLAREPVIAALLGMLIELEGYHPHFPTEGESVDDALSRLRPPIILCADCELAAVPTDLFFARAARARVRVVLFGGPAAAAGVRELAAERGLPFFLLPTDLDALARALDEAATVTSGP
jgi:hypothetical protein